MLTAPLISQIREIIATMNNEDCSAEDFASGRSAIESILASSFGISLSDTINSNALDNSQWLQTIPMVLDDIESPISPNNKYDIQFTILINFIRGISENALVKYIQHNIEALKSPIYSNYEGYISYYKRFPLWGSYDPDNKNYQTLELRAAVLKRRSYEFVWLYRRLCDYMSKYTLYAIMNSWINLDIQSLTAVKSIFPDYYEPDIFPNNFNDVFVDIGAYNGDSILQYIQTYGLQYKKIYGYEISPDICKLLKDNTSQYHDVIIRAKGAGSKNDVMHISNSSDSSANHLTKSTANSPSDKDSKEQSIEVVALDEDITEPVTFIKMDIEGAEYDALQGCRRIITTQHPKLAICTYHGYEDIVRLPKLIDSMNPNYEFYMRYNGMNLFPTEYVLLCRERTDI